MSLVIAALVLALAQPAPAPRARADDARVHRFHLRNGDYIEGRIGGETASALEIRVTDGLLLLPKHQVVRIEAVLLRTHETRRPATRRATAAPLPVVHESRRRVEAALEAARRGSIPREEAVKRMVETGPEAALFLVSSLEHLDADERSLALQSLHVLNNPETLPTILRLFDSEDPVVRVSAAHLAGALGDPNAGLRLRKLLKDSDPHVRSAAASAFEKLDDPVALDWVGPLCADPDPEARTAALDATVKLAQRHGMRETMLYALDRALRWPPKGGEPDILKSVGSCGESEAWEMAAAHLQSHSPRTRAAAAMAMASLAAPASADSVARHLELEADPEARIQLAFAAERLSIAKSAPALVEWLHEEHEGVRRAALRALRSLSGLGHGEDPEAWKTWLKARSK